MFLAINELRKSVEVRRRYRHKFIAFLKYIINIIIISCIYHTADRCVRSAFKQVYSAVWYRSRCYMAFVDHKSTWLEAASLCVHRQGRLASYRVNSVFVPFVRASSITHSCVWLGLVKNYLRWIIPSSQFLLVIVQRLRFIMMTK